MVTGCAQWEMDLFRYFIIQYPTLLVNVLLVASYLHSVHFLYILFLFFIFIIITKQYGMPLTANKNTSQPLNFPLK